MATTKTSTKRQTTTTTPMPMKGRVRKAVSEAITAFRYDRSQRLLEIEFNNGSTYQYGSVPQHVAKDMREADSKGRFFLEQIRPFFPYRRVNS